MIRLLKALGSAVLVGAGVKAGSDIYQAVKDRAGHRASPGEGEAAKTGADREAELEAERERIDEELRALRRTKKRKPSTA